MKRLFIPLLMAFLATSSSPVFAQIFVGPKAGVNFNSFRSSEKYESHFDVVPGFNFGAFGKYPVLPFLNARAEVIYSQQGANIYDYQVLNDLKRRNAKVKFHNIQIPILAELGLPSLAEEVLQPKLTLGGFYSYTIDAQETYTNAAKLSGSPEVKFDGSMDVSSQYVSSQFGLIAAIGAEVKIYNYPVAIEFRYQYNLPTINKEGTQDDLNLQPTTEVWGNDLHIHTLSVNVGVTLYNF